MNDTPLTFLAISGSLRSQSWNGRLLRAAAELAPADTTVEIYEGLAAIPPYNEDVKVQGYPAEVEDLRERIRRADALIIATPEYNRSFSGVLKNAIDWASRPPEQPFAGKPALVTGAGPGALGTALANYHLRQVLSVLGVQVLPGMEVLVGAVAEKFDDTGVLIHQPTKDALAKALNGLSRMARSGASLAA